MSTWSSTSRKQYCSANYNHYNKHNNNVEQHNVDVLVVPIVETPIVQQAQLHYLKGSAFLDTIKL